MDPERQVDQWHTLSEMDWVEVYGTSPEVDRVLRDQLHEDHNSWITLEVLLCTDHLDRPSSSWRERREKERWDETENEEKLWSVTKLGVRGIRTCFATLNFNCCLEMNPLLMMPLWHSQTFYRNGSHAMQCSFLSFVQLAIKQTTFHWTWFRLNSWWVKKEVI